MVVNGKTGVAVDVGTTTTSGVGEEKTDGVADGETSIVGGRLVTGIAGGEGVATGDVGGGKGFRGVCGLMAMMMRPKISPPVATSVKTVRIPGSRLTSAFLRLLPLHCSA